MSLWNTSACNKYIVSPQTLMQKNNPTIQRTSFCTCQKASLTVEAAVIIPLAAGFLVSILFLYRVMQVQAAVEEALIYAGRKTAVESSITSSEEVLFVSAKAFLHAALKDHDEVEDYVKNGAIGISLLKSDFSGKDIILYAEYEMKLPVSFFKLDAIKLWSQNRFQKWVGNLPAEGDEDWVYVTPNGTAYHISTLCQVLDLTVNEEASSKIDKRRGKNGQKYYPCSRCRKNGENATVVYYTNYGRLYHKDIDCSALKRTVIKVSILEVAGREPCSYCY